MLIISITFPYQALLAAVAFVEPRPSPGEADLRPSLGDAEPYLLYGGYGYGHLGYGGYYGYPYAHGHAYYGKRRKRSADAEPKADADPYLLYRGYGYYGHGYGLGYGLGYGGYYGHAYYG